MAISFPAPETAEQRLERETDERAQQPSLLANAAHLLRRGYERLNSAVFDPDGDIMRL